MAQSHPLPSQNVHLDVIENKCKVIQFKVDAIKRKDELTHHKLIITGDDPVPLEIRGPSNESAVGSVVERHDLCNTHEEADNIILDQVCMYIDFTILICEQIRFIAEYLPSIIC